MYGDEEDWPNQGAFWWANAQRALRGKRGRKALAELREALLMLPERRLVSGAISTVALRREAEEEPDMREGWAWDLSQPRPLVPNLGKQEELQKCDEEGPGVCAVGAYLARKRVLEMGETIEEAMAALPSSADVDGYDLNETAALGQQAGLTWHLAWLLAQQNDDGLRSCTPEERWEKYLAWIDKQLAVAS